ncbi:MAG: potassium transport protein Kup [Deltaproteobacteria bacterium ADurb.Bin510]|nr:MAG: potassium transport protein Kup [Deltaproteobacteria bacterium ADurb.Bin510]
MLGILSLVFWALMFEVSFKYLFFIMRADNRGEGGIFALLALAHPKTKEGRRGVGLATLIILTGAALLYGDGVITPAISVLSAVEGLEVATTAARPLIVPLTCLILFLLFAVQHHGTGGIGRIFGPVMLSWFAVIAGLGLNQIRFAPQILLALNPLKAVEFFMVNSYHGFVVLGSVVLCITGGEALYADLGHFGRKAIRLSWLPIAYPALILNYLGQGALLLNHPEAAYNPFYSLAPKGLLFGVVGLATLATVIASQAMISGTFSLTQQAIQVGLLPRLRIIHTSAHTRGQIYVPWVNQALGIACIGVGLAFKSSSGLAGSYGIAVTAAEAITSITFYFVATRTWHWSRLRALPLLVLFLFFDLNYFGANLFKVRDGGWFTLLVAALVVLAMLTWRQGRRILARRLQVGQVPLKAFLQDIAAHGLTRVKGTMVFMTVSPEGVPPALLHHLKHYQLLHERVILLSIMATDTPRVAPEERLQIDDLGQGFYRIVARYGFRETPKVPEIMALAEAKGLKNEPLTTTYCLGRETILPTGPSHMATWRKKIYAYMARNAQSPTTYFGLPANRVVELGAQIEL